MEFSDFECPYCAHAETTLRQLASKYGTQVRFAYRDFPLHTHLHAVAAAQASHCASEQGQFWTYHDLLFARQDNLDSDHLVLFASQLGMDSKAFSGCVSRNTFAAAVEQDVGDGQKLGIREIPTFFVNGISVTGAVSLEEFSNVIDAELVRQQYMKSHACH